MLKRAGKDIYKLDLYSNLPKDGKISEEIIESELKKFKEFLEHL